MAIDTAEKRKAACAAFLLLCAPGVTPNATQDAEWRQEALWSYPGISAAVVVTPPEDPDDDISVTSRADADGATLRPIRAVFSHAADDLREAEFVGFDRAHRIDRHWLRSQRAFRLPDMGLRFDVDMVAVRAGECFALQRFVAWVSPEGARPTAPDTTNRTDIDGATMRVPSFRIAVAADAERDADLGIIDAFVTDRHVNRHAIPDGQGLGQFFAVELQSLGRAGNTFALDRIVLWVSDAAEGRPGTET